MSACGVCGNSCDSSAETVKCSGGCDISFHLNCVKESVEGRKTRSFKDWKCKNCRSQSSTLQSHPGTAITKEFLLSVLDSFKKDVFLEIKNFVRDEIAPLTQSVQFMSDKIDESNKLMASLRGDILSLKKEVETIRSKQNSMATVVSDLKEKVRSLEQYTRRLNVEISGVPVSPKEDIVRLVKDVGKAMGVEVLDNHIAAAHRVPSYNKERIPSVVVQLQNKQLKDTWITNFRQKKTMTAKEVNAAFPNDLVYINDHLSPDNKILLSTLKKKAKAVGYTYAWCRDGKFYARKAPGEKLVRIVSYEDIDNLC
jgi:uncharacterized protein YoxC